MKPNQGSGSEEGKSNSVNYSGKVRKVALNDSLGSHGTEMLAMLNGIGYGNGEKEVLDNMQRFIEIGERLGYDMKGCKESREQLVTSLGELAVDK